MNEMQMKMKIFLKVMTFVKLKKMTLLHMKETKVKTVVTAAERKLYCRHNRLVQRCNDRPDDGGSTHL
jgi:hypothetical protein